MFDFFMDFGNYSDRVVGRDDFDWGFVSTAKVSDGSQPIETAVQHPDYNDGKMVIVEAYDDEDAAKAGHTKWVKSMTAETIPDSLTDCANSEIQQVIGKETFERQVKK